MGIKSALLILVLLFLFVLVTRSPIAAQTAQTDEKEKAEKAAEKKKELEHNTLALLDEVIGGAWGLKLADNRAFVLMRAADLLWTHDEKRARSLFWEALNSLAPVTNPTEDEPAKEPAAKAASKNSAAKNSNNDKALSEYFAIFERRREFLQMVARRDPQLALEMLRATRQTSPPKINAGYRLPDESDLEQEIANEAAARDPKRALQIARESLAKGFNYQLLGFLNRLIQTDQEIATQFAGEIIDKLDSANLAADPQSWWVAAIILRMSRTAPDSLTAADSQAAARRQLKLSDDQKRELIETLTDTVLSASANPNLVTGTTEIMPEIEQFAPDRVAKLRAKIEEVTRTSNRNQLDWNKYNSLVGKGTSPEEMMRIAPTLNDDARNELYREAILTAVVNGKPDSLREYINSHIEDESRRNGLLDSLDEEQIGAAINKGNPEELQKLLPLVRLKEARALAMSELALLLEKKGQHEDAVKMIEDAQALVKLDFKSEKQSNAVMAFLLAYAIVEPNKAFAIIEPIIDRANDDISKLMLLDKIVKSGAVKNGEIKMAQPGLNLDFEILKFGPGVVALAKADFNRTRSLADRFQRNEIRLTARLLLAQSILRSLETMDTPQTSAANMP